MTQSVNERVRRAFAPPQYLAPSLSGIDLSTSGAKAVQLVERSEGLMLARYSEARLPGGAFIDGEIADSAAVIESLKSVARAIGIHSANVALSESKSYLFDTRVAGAEYAEWRTAVEQRLEELVPLPPSETIFDFLKIGQGQRGDTHVAGVGFASRIINDLLKVFDEASIGVMSLEGETYAVARALLPAGDDSTVLIIDVGKTTTKMAIVTASIPRFAATINIGGHALTLAVQKHFGVTEMEARKIKAEKGIVVASGNEDYHSAMLSTVSAIRDELAYRLEYWQESVIKTGTHEPVTRAILAGGNASVRGFAEYLEGKLRIPVTLGDVFTNFASRDAWIPDLDYTESLAYATAIGLALRDTTIHA